MEQFGNKEKFALLVNPVELLHENEILYGGFELWLNSVKFGDIKYIDTLSGNILNMIQSLYEYDVPKYPFSSEMTDEKILNSIFYNYHSGIDNGRKKLLKDILEETIFWSRYIILPNDFAPFDQNQLVYFEKNDCVKLIYRAPFNTESIMISNQETKSILNSYLKWYSSLFGIYKK